MDRIKYLRIIRLFL